MKFSTTLAISPPASIISTNFYSARGSGDGIILIEDFSSPRLQWSQVNDPVMGVRAIIILLVNDHCYCQRFFLHVCVALENDCILSLHFMFYSWEFVREMMSVYLHCYHTKVFPSRFQTIKNNPIVGCIREKINLSISSGLTQRK